MNQSLLLKRSLLLILLVPTFPTQAQIVPAQDGTQTQIQTTGNQIDVLGGTRSRNNLFHSFERFGITPEQFVTIQSNPAIRNIFMRVSGNDASVINGLMQVSGGQSNLFLINPAGILFGPNARLNLPAAFWATTATSLQFTNGSLTATGTQNYDAIAGDPQQLSFAVARPGAIANFGQLAVPAGHSLNLIGGTVLNAGTITAPNGQITLASVPGGQQVYLSQTGNVMNLEFKALTPETLQTWNPSTLSQLLAKTAGITHANQLSITPEGKVQLSGSGLIVPEQSTVTAGTISAPQGQVQILGDRVALSNATVRAEQGSVLIGGSLQGQGTTPRATLTYVDRHSQILAQGGNIVVWSDQSTQFSGRAESEFVEISGKQRLGFDGQVHATTILFDPQDIIFQQSGATASNSVLESDSGTVLSISSDAIANSTGALTFAASNQIWFPREGLPHVLLGRGGNLTFRAGNRFIADLNLLSEGRSIDIQAPNIITQTINTGLANNANGSISLRGLNGGFAEQAIVGNLITSEQDVSIQARQISSQYILTSSGGTAARGSVNLQSQGVLRVGGILTAGQPVTLSTVLDQRSGFLQTGTIRTVGGAVTLQGNRINAGLIWTTPDSSGSAGNVVLTAQNNLSVSRIEANGKGSGSAGSVQLSSPGDVLVDSIQAYGGGQGGHVGIQGDRIQITGRVIPPDGSLTPPPISIRAGESVTIAHQGGKTNQPFMIGNPSVNGSAGGIQVGAAVLPQGSFPIQPQTVEYQPIDSVRIIAENDPPRFTAQAIQFLLRPGQRTDFTLEQLGVKAPADRNQDQVTILLRPNADFLAAGGQLLNANGLPLSADRPIQLSDRLTYIAPRQNAGVFDAFEIIAIDHVSFAGGSSAQRIPLRFDNVGLIPQAEPAAPKPAAPAPAAPSGSSISNISAGELAAMDSQLSQDFQSAGIQNGATNSDPNTLTRQMERQTGIRSALVYLRLLKTPSGHELSITLATAKGRFQKRVMVNATELNDTIAQFRREVTNPLKTHTKSYLPAAKQLYRWMIAPIYEDLQAQGVTNLVFLPEAGLRSLPYGALHSGRQFLIEQFSLGLMPSVGLTQTSYQQIQQANLLAVGVSESTQGQAALPMVKTELAMIAQLWAKQTAYLNQAATVDQLRQARQRHPFEIVHLATHANFQAGAPKDAYIQLWNQQLKLEQIRGFNWHNPPVELLVLSACRTAIGDRESELGFAGLAVQTGVKTAVASLWYVNDTATTALISKFYQTLRSSRVKVEALRQAQLAMMRGDVTITEGKITGLSTPIALPEDLQVSDPNFRHPYYWAAFTMVGSPW